MTSEPIRSPILSILHPTASCNSAPFLTGAIPRCALESRSRLNLVDIKGRYLTVARVASGASGTVWKAKDIRSGGFVAIKIGHRFFARVLDRTMFQGLPCLVYPLGAASLDRVLDACRLRPLPRAHIRAIVWQLSNAVALNARTKFVHDPTADNSSSFNEVLVDVSVKLVDLDDVVEVGFSRRWLVGTEVYRAPEVTIGSIWSKPIDVFALGCLAAELFTGSPIFQPCRSPQERLASLEHVIGMGRTGYGEIHIDKVKRFSAGVFAPRAKAMIRIRAMAPLKVLIGWDELFMLCQESLLLDPATRITIEGVLSHSYFMGSTQFEDKGGRLAAYRWQLEQRHVAALILSTGPQIVTGDGKIVLLHADVFLLFRFEFRPANMCSADVIQQSESHRPLVFLYVQII
ncbi:kinase-like domain-containing protein [Mycena alexandri]|uniref:Kinase-like domain-containing protein n=1 Tax=Mycena alexandri TaxID=1745969 RepID=A0AAD6RZN4_9AGAR|nr:kinase-like domain-containing protein [Mycena alexandri]